MSELEKPKRKYTKKPNRAECGARKDDGTLCTVPPMANGKCYHHGGASKPPGPDHPRWKHGEYSRYKDVIPENLGERYQAALQDENLLAGWEEIALLDARLGSLLKRVDTGEAGSILRKAREELKLLDQAMIDGDVQGVKTHMAQLKATLGRGVADYAAWDEIKDVVALRDRLAQSERKRMVEAKLTLDLRTGQAIIIQVLQSVERHVGDRRILAAIGQDLGPVLGLLKE